MKEITKNIKERKFHKVYLLTGDEGYLILQARQMLKKAMIPDGDTMNYVAFEEAKIKLPDLADLSQTYPFFGEKRMIVLNQTNIISTGKDEFLKILETMPDTTCMVISEFKKVDARTKVYKWIKKNGYVAEFKKENQKEKTLLMFLARSLAQSKIQIRESDARYFISKVGSDLFQIKNEAEKLISYMGEETVVTKEAMDAILTDQIENKIYELITAIANKDQNRALKLYNDLIILKEKPTSILSLIVRQYRIMNILKSMAGQGKPMQEMAAAVKLSPYVTEKYLPQIRLYTSDQIEKCLMEAIDMDYQIKSGQIKDEIAIVMLITSLVNQ